MFASIKLVHNNVTEIKMEVGNSNFDFYLCFLNNAFISFISRVFYMLLSIYLKFMSFKITSLPF